eukprot:PhF_6_TR8075/c0_g1_i1/m.12496/K06689/UBE2D, UBC4, UBC5; ubiquitin-conjugating enzyme E2 D
MEPRLLQQYTERPLFVRSMILLNLLSETDSCLLPPFDVVADVIALHEFISLPLPTHGAIKRVQKELFQFEKDMNPSVAYLTHCAEGGMNDKGMPTWSAVLFGPSDTPYQGGAFTINISISQDYPFQPPRVKFSTSIMHPNICRRTGAISLDVLKESWAPTMTIYKVVLAILHLMQYPNPDEPMDP